MQHSPPVHSICTDTDRVSTPCDSICEILRVATTWALKFLPSQTMRHIQKMLVLSGTAVPTFWDAKNMSHASKKLEP